MPISAHRSKLLPIAGGPRNFSGNWTPGWGRPVTGHRSQFIRDAIVEKLLRADISLSKDLAFAAASVLERSGCFLQTVIRFTAIRLRVEREGRFQKGCGFRTEARLKVQSCFSIALCRSAGSVFLIKNRSATVAKEVGMKDPAEKNRLSARTKNQNYIFAAASKSRLRGNP